MRYKMIIILLFCFSLTSCATRAPIQTENTSREEQKPTSGKNEPIRHALGSLDGKGFTKEELGEIGLVEEKKDEKNDVGSDGPEKENVVGAMRPVIMGSLTKEQIRAVIKKGISQIKYCYEKQLAKKPDLAGRVDVKFIIAKDGNVSATSLMKSLDKDVDECVQKVIKGMTFPAPSGGGIVIVKYPFNFKSKMDE